MYICLFPQLQQVNKADACDNALHTVPSLYRARQYINVLVNYADNFIAHSTFSVISLFLMILSFISLI